jgi:fatty acid-binding protein DegV
MKEGILEKGGFAFAKDIAEALFKKVSKEKKGEKIRAIINHCDNLEGAKKLKELLKQRQIEISFISEGPNLFAVTGPGALMVGWMPI